MSDKGAGALQKLLEVFEKRPVMTLILVLVLAFMVYEYSHKPPVVGTQQIKSTGNGNTNTNIQ